MLNYHGVTYVDMEKALEMFNNFLPVVFWIPMRIFFISSPKKLLSFQNTCYILSLSLMTFETNSFSGLWSHLHLLSLWWNEIWPENRSKRIPWLCSLIILLYYIFVQFVHTSYTHVQIAPYPSYIPIGRRALEGKGGLAADVLSKQLGGNRAVLLKPRWNRDASRSLASKNTH